VHLFASVEDEKIGKFLHCFKPEAPALWYTRTPTHTHSKQRWPQQKLLAISKGKFLFQWIRNFHRGSPQWSAVNK